jgi:hypothetical protein
MRIFLPQPLPKPLIHTSFLFRFTPNEKIGGLFKENLPPNFFESADVQYVDTAEAADIIILPNNFTSLDTESESYIKKYADLSEKLHKPLYIFSCGDYSDALSFDMRANVFKYSLYRSKKSPQEISTPTLTEDIGRGGIPLRTKNKLATVSFCGKAGFASTREWLGSFVRRIKFTLLGAPARVRGVYWRIWAIGVCQGSNLIKTNFILRKTFSGAARTIEVPPEQARKDFVGSVRESDFVLAPKGDGNYSNRFLEALSMGRIPVLVDTDTVLPFEDEIEYAKIIVRVPMYAVSKIPSLVKDYYDALSEEEWSNRQQLARTTFEKYLRQDSFFRHYFREFLK